MTVKQGNKRVVIPLHVFIITGEQMHDKSSSAATGTTVMLFFNPSVSSRISFQQQRGKGFVVPGLRAYRRMLNVGQGWTGHLALSWLADVPVGPTQLSFSFFFV